MKIAAFYENIMDGADAEKIPVLDAVRALKESGLESLYIHGWTVQNRREEVETVLLETGLAVEGLYTILSLGEDPNDSEPEELIREANRLGAGNVMIVPGTCSEHIANMKDGLLRAVRTGEEVGVRVTLEDFDGVDAPFSSVSGLLDFLNSVPGLGCSFDTGNFMHGEDPLSALPLFRDRICNIHLKDRSHEPNEGDGIGRRCADGSKVFAVPVGTGYLPIQRILRQLQEWAFTGTIIVELYGYEAQKMLEGLQSSICWTREQLNTLNVCEERTE